MDKKLIISRDLAQAILDYLVEQPFKDVYKLVTEIQQLKPIEENKIDTGQ